jgi:hypothetical protein
MLRQPWFSSALRSSAAPIAAGRAATSFARGGGFGLLASGATQCNMRAVRVPSGARSNPFYRDLHHTMGTFPAPWGGDFD